MSGRGRGRGRNQGGGSQRGGRGIGNRGGERGKKDYGIMELVFFNFEFCGISNSKFL